MSDLKSCLNSISRSRLEFLFVVFQRLSLLSDKQHSSVQEVDNLVLAHESRSIYLHHCPEPCDVFLVPSAAREVLPPPLAVVPMDDSNS